MHVIQQEKNVHIYEIYDTMSKTKEKAQFLQGMTDIKHTFILLSL